MGLAMLGSSTIATAQGDNNSFDYANITCPADVTIECGQNINDPDLTGLPSIQLISPPERNGKYHSRSALSAWKE